jgi:hypothetical protein
MAIQYQIKIVTTTPYNVVNSDEVIFINVNGPASVILPSSAGNSNEAKAYYIKDYSGQSQIKPITITSAGGKTIDGSPFGILNTPYSHVQLVYDGANWKTI